MYQDGTVDGNGYDHGMKFLAFLCASLFAIPSWADDAVPQALHPGLELAVDRFPDPAERGAILPPSAAKADAPYPLEETLTLHSKPDATKRVYLDFDGHTVHWGRGE